MIADENYSFDINAILVTKKQREEYVGIGELLLHCVYKYYSKDGHEEDGCDFDFYRILFEQYGINIPDEETLYQTKSKSNQDPLNFPIRLNNKLAHLNSLTRIGSYAPTQQAIDVKNEISKEIDKELAKLYDIFNHRIKTLNEKIKDSRIDLIRLD